MCETRLRVRPKFLTSEIGIIIFFDGYFLVSGGKERERCEMKKVEMSIKQQLRLRFEGPPNSFLPIS